jgi:hypothetical protein
MKFGTEAAGCTWYPTQLMGKNFKFIFGNYWLRFDDSIFKLNQNPF